MVDVFPDRLGNVRNVEILVKLLQDGSRQYVPSAGMRLRRHVNNVLVLVPVEDQSNGELQQEEDLASETCEVLGGL